MTRPQKKTAIVLLVWVALQVVLGVGLLAWEGYAVSSPDQADLITTVVKIAWANQPWPFLLGAVVVTFVVAFLCGHFFSGPRSELDEIRSGKWTGKS